MSPHRIHIAYTMPSILARLLAGMQYASGDLQADDSPSAPSKP